MGGGGWGVGDRGVRKEQEETHRERERRALRMERGRDAHVNEPGMS